MDYCSAAEVRAYSGVATSEMDDTGLQVLIDGVESEIDSRTGRTWQGIATASEKYYRGKGTTWLYLDNMDVWDLTSIAIDSDNTGTFTDVTPSKVKVMKAEGILQLKEDAEITVFPTWTNSVSMTYTYGAASASVPSDIKTLAIQMVSQKLRFDPVLKQEIDSYIKKMCSLGTFIV